MITTYVSLGIFTTSHLCLEVYDYELFNTKYTSLVTSQIFKYCLQLTILI